MYQNINKLCCTLLVGFLIFGLGSAHAGIPVKGLTTDGLLNSVSQGYLSVAQTWEVHFLGAARFIFWFLSMLSIVFGFGMLALRKADFGDFFIEFFRFIMFFGVFYQLMEHGPEFAGKIIDSLNMLGERATGINDVSPSGIINIGWSILEKANTKLTMYAVATSFFDSLSLFILTIMILLVLAIVAFNMLCLQITGFILMYAGIIFLGFRGSRWTSSIAINYYRSVGAFAVELMMYVLIVGIGKHQLDKFIGMMNLDSLQWADLAIFLIAALLILILSNNIPSRISSILGGPSGIGNTGVLGFAMSAAAMTTAATAMAAATGSLAKTMGKGVAGGMDALDAAVSAGSSTDRNLGGGGANSQRPSMDSFNRQDKRTELLTPESGDGASGSNVSASAGTGGVESNAQGGGAVPDKKDEDGQRNGPSAAQKSAHGGPGGQEGSANEITSEADGRNAQADGTRGGSSQAERDAAQEAETARRPSDNDASDDDVGRATLLGGGIDVEAIQTRLAKHAGGVSRSSSNTLSRLGQGIKDLASDSLNEARRDIRNNTVGGRVAQRIHMRAGQSQVQASLSETYRSVADQRPTLSIGPGGQASTPAPAASPLAPNSSQNFNKNSADKAGK